jgi:hypothetical protein
LEGLKTLLQKRLRIPRHKLEAKKIKMQFPRLKNFFRRGGQPLPQPAVVPGPPPGEQEWQRRIRVLNEHIQRRQQEIKLAGQVKEN